MRHPPFGVACIAGILVSVLTLTGCALLGDSDPAPPPAPDRGLERSALHISIMPTTDLAPFHLAVKNGLFQAEGLSIRTSTAGSGPASVTKLVAREVDIAYGSYPPFFVAQAKNVADIKIVADSSAAGPGSTMIVAMPGSPVRTIQDMAGKRIAVTSTATTSDLMTMAAMKAAGVDHTRVQWVTLPFPDMAARLQRGDVDAAFMTEPFITQAVRTVGAVPVADPATGPIADFPTAGYGAMADFVAQNPRTVAAFQRVMAKATAEAADRSRVEPLLVEFAKVDSEIARGSGLLTFKSEMDAASIQRVPDVMAEFGFLPGRVDVAAMIVPPR
jgi:NitT/TauT family transport system substrate-binding protein